jgi:hypothetical protein
LDKNVFTNLIPRCGLPQAELNLPLTRKDWAGIAAIAPAAHFGRPLFTFIQYILIIWPATFFSPFPCETRFGRF